MSSENKEKENRLNHQDVIETIGHGSFGKVCKVRHKKNGKIQVWKEIGYEKMCHKERQQLVNEVNILRELDHDYIVKQKDRIIDKSNQKIQIVMEYCEGGDIARLIKQCRKENDFIAEEVIWKVLQQLTRAIKYCHSKKILHRDLKPGNLFVDAQKNIKLGDFGLSRMLGKDSICAKTNVGTPQQMSPEVIGEKDQDEKSDMWSMGCLIQELANLRPPFEAQNQQALAIKIKNGDQKRLPISYSEDLMDVVKQMLNKSPRERPNAADLCDQPLLKIRHKEQELRGSYQRLKKNADEVNAKQKALDKRQAEITTDLEAVQLGVGEDELDAKISETERKIKELNDKNDSNAKKPISAKEVSMSILGDVTNWNMQPLFEKKKYDSMPNVTEVGSILELDLV